MTDGEIAGARLLAEVAVEGTLYSFDTLFSYEIPEALRGRIDAGMRVVVPFGRGNRRRQGLVMSLCESSGEKCKEICSSVDDQPVISAEMLRLCGWIRENTFCTYFDAFRAILPSGLGYSLKTRYCVNKDFTGGLSDEERRLFEQLMNAGDRSAADSAVSASQERDGGRLIRALLEKGALREDDVLKRRVGDESISMLRLSGEETDASKLTPKQREVVRFVEENECAGVREVCYACSCTTSVVKRLVEKNVLEQYENVVFRTEPSEEATESPDSIVFSKKQQEVYNGLLALMNSSEPKCALLRGITGSGKTSVFIRLINDALKQGKSAIMLVPEISLTPQMVGKFRRLFGSQVAIMHSGLSLGGRADEYRRIKSGSARIVIGTRSAVFAPVSNLGIIVIDEEGEGTYKSESAPRYHARDIAKQRCFAHNAFLLLASATPSLESCYNAKTGRYSLFELDERYNNAVLPDVYMVDMREEAKNGNHSSFSMPLIQEIQANLDRGEQSILLLNRRGYHTSVRCAACGAAAECPECSIALTYHKANDSLICHYCGYMRRMDKVCGKCGAGYFDMRGTGTQRIEDEIAEMFPTARVLRMDADTTSTKNAFERKFRAFADGEYDIIVGTQMIAKGLDFPNVTLVGVLKIDNSLYASDFRAFERTFSLITQVVGRSGRGGKKGRAMLQTFSPEHYVLNLAANQNYPAFYDEEIQLREAMLYPPFCDICVFGFTSLLDKPCESAARQFAGLIAEYAKPYGERVPLRILGPAPSTIGRLNGRFRYRLLVKCRNNSATRSVFSAALKQTAADPLFRNVSVFADMNGEI